MPAYCFVDVLEITDPEKMEEYRQRVIPVVERYGGRYLAVGGPFEVVEGEWRPAFPVLLEFPNLEQARSWYDSEDYRDLKELRQASAKSNAVFIAGLPAE